MDRIDIINALNADDFSPYRRLADDIRRVEVGDTVHIRAILEYSNYCRRKCSYCGLNCNNNNLTRYRLSDEVIIDTARRAHEAGYRTLVMQGGEDPYFDSIHLGELVKEMNKMGMIITLSAGEMTYEELAYLNNAGASRYLLKHETANSSLYERLHGDYSLSRRIDCIRNIKSLGYDTGSGFMVGLPTQTIEDLADDILLLEELSCDMAGIGTFIPHPHTPLAAANVGSIELTLRCVALTRIVIPRVNLPATTSLHVASGSDSGGIFDYGANVIMRKITPTTERKLYEIYPSNARETDIVQERLDVEQLVINAGRLPL